MFEGPEKKFQKHIADFLIREHGFAVLTQDEITDTDFYFAEDHLYALLEATQSETLERLEVDYGSDSRDVIYKALREEISCRSLWSVIRSGLSVRGHDFKLYFPKPRSSENVATQLYGEDRITFIPELVIKGAARPEFGFFLNGLPIVTMKLEHESIRQTVVAHRTDIAFLESVYKGQINEGIQDAYALRGLYEQLGDPKYTDRGAIFDIMAYTVIQKGLEIAEAA